MVPAHRVVALAQYSKLTTKRGSMAFLGSISFYRRYLQKLATQTALLTPLTAKQAPQRVEWSEEGTCAFNTICSYFCDMCVLCIPLSDDKFSIVTDASGKGIGGVLQVHWKGDWQPAAFFSRQLWGAEQRYSATELEALALAETVSHFAYYLYGRRFTAYTDHKPLEQLLTSTRLNPWLQWLSYKLQHWMMSIEYIPGAQNTLADALSREERPPPGLEERQEQVMQDKPGITLALGDVEGTPPQRSIVAQPLEVAKCET